MARLVPQDSIEEPIGALVSDKRALFRGLFDGTNADASDDGKTRRRRPCSRQSALGCAR
jgi:hypothetical protein